MLSGDNISSCAANAARREREFRSIAKKRALLDAATDPRGKKKNERGLRASLDRD